MEGTIEIRPYVDADWRRMLEVCLLAFAPIHKSFQVLLGDELFRLAYPDWKASHESYLRSLCATERHRLLVAEQSGAVLGFIHYEVSTDGRSGKIGLNAVHPDHQREGIGTRMYEYVLSIMRTAGLEYVHVDTGGDPSHVPARLAYEKLGFIPIPLVHYYKKL